TLRHGLGADQAGQHQRPEARRVLQAPRGVGGVFARVDDVMGEKLFCDQLDDVLARAERSRAGGDCRAAAAVLDAAPEPVRSFGSWHYARGTAALELGDCARAISEFEEAATREPDVPEFRANLGAALLDRVRHGDRSLLPRALQVLEAACG